MSFSANTDGIKILSAALKACVPEVTKELRRRLAGDVGPLIGHVAERNADWSKKIPRTIRWSMTGPTTVTVRAGYRSVPIAKWFELGHAHTYGKWNHPVYPSRKVPRRDWHWTAMREPHRPYLAPALAETKTEATQRILVGLVSAIEDTLGVATK